MSKKLAIHGCGNMGISLLHKLCEKIESYYKPNSEKQIIEIVDPGIIIPEKCVKHNLGLENYSGMYKVDALQIILENKFKSIIINPVIHPWTATKMNDDCFVIDCIDSTSQLQCNMKVSCEGQFGKIIINPKPFTGKSVQYSLEKSVTSAQIFSEMIVDEILSFSFENIPSWKKDWINGNETTYLFKI